MSAPLAVATGHTEQVDSIAVSFQFFVTGSSDKTVRVWEIPTGRQLAIGQGHMFSVHAVAIANSNEWIVSGARDAKVNIWDVRSGNQISSWKGHKTTVTALAISPDDKLIASGSMDRTLKIWDRAAGKEIATIPHTLPVAVVRFSNDGKQLLVGEAQDKAHIWDVTGANVKTIDQAMEHCHDVIDTGSKKLCAYVQRQRVVVLRDMLSDATIQTGESDAPIAHATFSGDGSVVAASAQSGNTFLWKTANGQAAGKLDAPGTSIECLALARNGSYCAAGATDGTVRLWKTGL
eukprot:TRINITY_DN92939_c0_g1_i1.p1 TRINITY_DN92939_c0_g1~~TRINITY_DN92939_c0_g1_i1.p1  ORF type:complete len:291 (+),score=60.37 TRINITY_DN92939_c0_g1_i1:51-923(+)